MERYIVKFPVNAGDGVARVFFLDQDGSLWIDPLMIQVDRAFALKEAGTACEPVVIGDEQAFYRLQWLEKISGYTGAKLLQMKLEKITLKEPGELGWTFDHTLGVQGNGGKTQ